MPEKQDLHLIAAIQAGNTDAFEPLLVRYRPLVENAVSSFSRDGMNSAEELRAEAEYALYCAALRFDTEQSQTSFGLYAKICLKNRLISVFSRKRGETALSLDDLLRRGDIADSSPSDFPGERLADADSLRLLYRKIRGVLSPYEMSVFRLWVEELPSEEIAKALGKDEKSVSNAIARSLKKLREALN